jgi:ABC-type transport system involved in cytochrome bd biosynthesis fused ATPase/permease subunit
MRSRMTIIPQEPVLLSGTLRQTLDMSGELGQSTAAHTTATLHELTPVCACINRGLRIVRSVEARWIPQRSRRYC